MDESKPVKFSIWCDGKFYSSYIRCDYFGLLPRLIFLWCDPRAFRFGSPKLERQTNLVILNNYIKSNVGPQIRVEHIVDLRFFHFNFFFHFVIPILSCRPLNACSVIKFRMPSSKPSPILSVISATLEIFLCMYKLKLLF